MWIQFELTKIQKHFFFLIIAPNVSLVLFLTKTNSFSELILEKQSFNRSFVYAISLSHSI